MWILLNTRESQHSIGRNWEVWDVCSCQHFDCWSTTCADFLNTTNCCANTPHSYNTLPHLFLESFSQTWKHSACSFLYAFASQPYRDEWDYCIDLNCSFMGCSHRTRQLNERWRRSRSRPGPGEPSCLVRQLFLQMNWITSRFVGIIYQPKNN